MLLIHECNAQLTEINQAWWGMQPICDSPTLSHSLLAALRVRSRLHDKWTIYSRLCLQETYLLKIIYLLCPRLCLILCSPSSILFSDLQSAPRKILQKWGVCIFRHPRVPENKDIPYDHPFSTIKVSTGRITNLLLPLCCTPVNKLILLSAITPCVSLLPYTHTFTPVC